ncbi:MAG TPA: GNAT family N-acetyltransferase [Candidatus Paceibacterota bacterium]|jgi:ribosomal protein S18 acetylase RimI-like enzyme
MSVESKGERGPQMPIELQRMTLDDLEAYVALEKKVQGKTYAAAQDRSEAEEEYRKGPMFFIRRGDQVVGAASYAIEEDGRAYINGLAIDPEYQKQGLGRRALEQILEHLKSAPQVWLRVHPENNAVKLYQSYDFQITGREENYDDTGEPRLILTRNQSVSEEVAQD